MTKKLTIQLFEAKKVRTVWDDEQEKWYFSIVDVCEILTEQPDTEHARNYWKVLKHRLRKEGNETVTNCNRLKLRAADGKMRLTDVADTEQPVIICCRILMNKLKQTTKHERTTTEKCNTARGHRGGTRVRAQRLFLFI